MKDYFRNNWQLNSSLYKAYKFLNTSSCPIGSFYKNLRFNDEPLLYQYTAVISLTMKNGSTQNDVLEWVGGMSFNQEKAKMKTLGEAMERYCLAVYKRSDLICGTVETVGKRVLWPETVVSFSQRQRKQKDFKKFHFNNDTRFFWSRGYSLLKREHIFISSQLIYVPYEYHDEPIIRYPISTGAACGDSLPAALYRGICEVVERDSFMIFYLNKLVPPKIDLKNSGVKLFEIYRYFQRYNLELMVFNITTDIGIPVVMSIIIDRTHVGPYISIGLKCSLSLEEAIIGSIEEAQHTRPWMRDERAKIRDAELEKIKKNPKKICTPRERGLFWYDGHLVDQLDFWLKPKQGERQRKVRKDVLRVNDAQLLRQSVETLASMNYNVFYTDITTLEILSAGFHVVKVVIPKLHPLYLEERYKYLGGERLYEVPEKLGYTRDSLEERELNNVPHPFL